MEQHDGGEGDDAQRAAPQEVPDRHGFAVFSTPQQARGDEVTGQD